ncbi:MAG: threonine synthase [Candidatus Helarchaeota archaeon]
MVDIKSLKCFQCGKTFSPEKLNALFRCPICNSGLNAIYDYDAIQIKVLGNPIIRGEFVRRPPHHWKYFPFYPINNTTKVISMAEGGTPLLESKRVTKELELKHLYFKYEGANPTGSFKDRGSSVELTNANELNAKSVICASTGNMGASVAAYAAMAGIQCTILIPESIPDEKLAQIYAYGAKIIQVKTNLYQSVQRLSELAASEFNYFLLGDYINRTEGEKSVGFEIIDQLGWKPPDYIFSPIGTGTLIWAIWKSFLELKEVGLIEKLPKVIGVQAKNCAPVIDALAKNSIKITPIKDPQTVASAIACPDPITGSGAILAMKNSNGSGIAVTEGEILDARRKLAHIGLFAEPSGAVSFAGLLKIQERLDLRHNSVVCVITGHGLKDAQTGYTIQKTQIKPNIDALKDLLI